MGGNVAMRILYVEDDARMRALVRRGLTEEGHTVVEAADGDPAAGFQLRQLLEDGLASFRVVARDQLADALVRGLQRREIAQLAAGDLHVAIGTHALIQKGVTFKNLGLAVVDEQHKFGVLQRKTLIDKGYQPDMLVLTATPMTEHGYMMLAAAS